MPYRIGKLSADKLDSSFYYFSRSRVDSKFVQVICSGHSLGAALASLCSVWASVQYPNADVQSVTIGQVDWHCQPSVQGISPILCRVQKGKNLREIV